METLDNTRTISLRIDEKLIQRIETDAKEEHRNRSQQILHMIATYYEMKEKMK